MLGAANTVVPCRPITFLASVWLLVGPEELALPATQTLAESCWQRTGAILKWVAGSRLLAVPVAAGGMSDGARSGRSGSPTALSLRTQQRQSPQAEFCQGKHSATEST